MTEYDSAFYDMINDGSYRSAKKVIPHVLNAFQNAGFDRPEVVRDFGCGQGAWLKAFKEEGMTISGFDGSYVDKDKLLIDPLYFSEIDFATQEPDLEVPKWADLVISLEVAEHLPTGRADVFVKSLVDASDVVLFSAAIPGQGGVGHVNEQWPEYWAKKFESHGYYVSDSLRWKIWDDPEVEPWYKQNLLICSKADMYLNVDYKSVVHPIVWDHIRGAG